MRKAFVFMAVLMITVFSRSNARILNVPCDYATIQAGIDASYDGDTVLVAPATYFENINFNGQNITLCSRFLIYYDTTAIYETIIDGDSLDSVVKFNHNETGEAAIIGFFIRNGSAQNGGGICCIGADPQIKWNIITGNIAHHPPNQDGYGGGIYCDSSNAIISYNVICRNLSEINGGGIACNGSSPLISHNVIYKNRAYE